MNLLRKLGFLLVFPVVTVLSPQAVLADESNAKVVITAAFGLRGANLSFPIGDAEGHVIIQQIRTDPLQSQDPRWNNLTAKIHEQLDAYATQGSFRIYAEISDPANASRGKAYAFYNGAFLVNLDGSASFSATGNLLGGTGEFAGLNGKVSVDGGITAAGGRYTLTLHLK